jgi:hypothetical protein
MLKRRRKGPKEKAQKMVCSQCFARWTDLTTEVAQVRSLKTEVGRKVRMASYCPCYRRADNYWQDRKNRMGNRVRPMQKERKRRARKKKHLISHPRTKLKKVASPKGTRAIVRSSQVSSHNHISLFSSTLLMDSSSREKEKGSSPQELAFL